MKANDLRIGNWLICYDERVSVTQIRKDTVHYEYLSKMGNIISTGEDIENFKPIPLTEEILLRWGFEKDNETYSWSKLFNFDNYDYLFELECWPNDDNFYFQSKYRKVEYVHDMQNLFKALTDQELKIKWT